MPQHHAAVGGSAISRILRCPGSVRLAASLPRTSSAAADRGTMLHHFIGTVIDKGIEPSALVGQSHMGVRLDSGDAKSMLVPARAMTYRFIGDCVPRMEQKVRFEPQVWGSADLLAHRAHVGFCADYKFGEHVVPAAESEQLLFYSAAAWEQQRFGTSPYEVRAAIIQPSVSTMLDTVKYTPRELTLFAEKVRAIARVALAPGAPVIAGEVQCKWCPVRQAGVCPALSKGGGELTDALAALKLRA